MAKKESIQKKLQKVRPPRVQLTYDVERGDAIEQKELPFVLGVVGDFSGQSQADLPRLKDRKFVNVDVDNFDDVMRGLAPRVAYQVKNRLTDQGGTFGVGLTFQSIRDFRPESVVQQVEPLRALVEARSKLAELRNKLAGNDKLEELLAQVMMDTEAVRKLADASRTQPRRVGDE
jgi:type VI secretion system protein ImpB